MIKVVICEDQEKQLNEIADIVKKQIIIEDYDMEISLATQAPRDVISFIDEVDDDELLFF